MSDREMLRAVDLDVCTAWQQNGGVRMRGAMTRTAMSACQGASAGMGCEIASKDGGPWDTVAISVRGAIFDAVETAGVGWGIIVLGGPQTTP